jgi:hypothetical protein
MSVYDRDAPLHAQPRLAQEQVQGARADYEVMRATTWRWGDGRLMTEYEMMYIAAALQRGTDEFPWAAEELARSRDLLQQWEAQRRAEREARAMPLLKFWGLSLVGLPVVFFITVGTLPIFCLADAVYLLFKGRLFRDRLATFVALVPLAWLIGGFSTFGVSMAIVFNAQDATSPSLSPAWLLITIPLFLFSSPVGYAALSRYERSRLTELDF